MQAHEKNAASLVNNSPNCGIILQNDFPKIKTSPSEKTLSKKKFSFCQRASLPTGAAQAGQGKEGVLTPLTFLLLKCGMPHVGVVVNYVRNWCVFFGAPTSIRGFSTWPKWSKHQEKTELALTPWPPCAARRPRRPAAAGGAPWLDYPGQQVAAAALCSPKLGHHHRRSHDGSYSLPLGWPIGFLASFRGLFVCLNFYI